MGILNGPHGSEVMVMKLMARDACGRDAVVCNFTAMAGLANGNGGHKDIGRVYGSFDSVTGSATHTAMTAVVKN